MSLEVKALIIISATAETCIQISANAFDSDPQNLTSSLESVLIRDHRSKSEFKSAIIYLISSDETFFRANIAHIVGNKTRFAADSRETNFYETSWKKRWITSWIVAAL